MSRTEGAPLFMTNEPTPTSKSKILIVDDQPTNIRIVYELLGNDHEVIMATDSRDVFRMCREEQPDLILLDVRMPHLSGYEVCERLKAGSETRDIPVMFITSAQASEEEERGLNAGAVDFVSKPIVPATLRARVRTHLQLKRQTDELRRQAHVDGLTLVANRRRFDEHFATEWRAGQRDGEPVALLLIDIGHFKLYNDHYGHQDGDEALKAVASVLRSSLRRPRDFVARYGGEEFVCVFPNTNLKEATDIANHLRQQIEAARLPHQPSPIADALTISLGAAARIPSATDTANALLRLADQNLYRAKTAGRNRVFAANGSDEWALEGRTSET